MLHDQLVIIFLQKKNRSKKTTACDGNTHTVGVMCLVQFLFLDVIYCFILKKYGQKFEKLIKLYLGQKGPDLKTTEGGSFLVYFVFVCIIYYFRKKGGVVLLVLSFEKTSMCLFTSQVFSSVAKMVTYGLFHFFETGFFCVVLLVCVTEIAHFAGYFVDHIIDRFACVGSCVPVKISCFITITDYFFQSLN